MQKTMITGVATLLFTTSAVLAEPCATGRWTLETQDAQADGTMRTSNATSTRYCLADGHVQMDEFRALNEEGAPVFWGASFQNVIEGPGEAMVLWIMVGDPGYTMIPVTYHEDGTQTSGGGGSDGRGAFLERAETTYENNRDYHFDMDRSYDGGETWIDPFNVIEATFVSDDVAPLPEALVPPMAEGVAALPEGTPRGTPVLDGTAEVRTFEQDGQLMLEFASRYWEPNRWRVATWEVGTDEISFEEYPF